MSKKIRELLLVEKENDPLSNGFGLVQASQQAFEDKKRNLIVHKCFESEAGVLEEEQEDDLRSLQGLFNELGLRDMVAKDALIGWRTLGKVKQSDDQPRPLLLIFKTRADRDKLLDRAPRLSRHVEEDYRNINIVADLTRKQRQMEQEMYRKADKSNLDRNHDQVSKNIFFKVLGKRGDRVLWQVELRQNEKVTEEGKDAVAGSMGPGPIVESRARNNRDLGVQTDVRGAGANRVTVGTAPIQNVQR